MSEMDIPTNSHKSQQESNQGASGGVQKPPVPVFDGKSAGAKRKNDSSLWKWFKRLFLSDRSPKDIAREVFEETVVPDIKDNFRNGVVAMLDGIIWKNYSPGRGSSTSNTVNYNKVYTSQQPRSIASGKQQQTVAEQQNEDAINNGFRNPCFQSKPEASRFLELMKGYDFPTLSVHTMYMMRKKHIDYTWDAYGWTREEIAGLTPACIKRISDPNYPYMIELPEAHVIQ